MAEPAFVKGMMFVLGLAGVPLVAYAAAEPAAKSGDYYNKKICQTVRPTGSRLGGTRRCLTQAEMDKARREDRTVTERMQALKLTFCPPPPHDC